MIQTPRNLTTLDQLDVGQLAVVTEINSSEPELVRLRVMGVCVGQGVHVIRAGRRMIICVGGTRIGLADQVARAVVVRLLPESSDQIFDEQEIS